MADWKDEFTRKTTTAGDAVRAIGRGDHVFIGSGCAEPQTLVRALAENPNAIDVEILHILTLGVAPYADPRFPDRFRHNALFIGANVREAVHTGAADYTPVFLSEIPALFRSGRLRVDAALVQVSPPDRAGYVSLGISIDVVKAAIDSADIVIAEVNPRMPRTHGDSFVHVRDLDWVVECESALLELPPVEPDAVCQEIARHVAALIPDEATIQMGIGEIPQALMSFLADKHELGVHTEMFSDGIIDLIEAGTVTNRHKPVHAGKVVAAFCMGTRRLYDYVHDNPRFEFHGVDYVNDPFLISRHDRMVAINSALEIDLTGQVCADSIGASFFSGIGGQVDFIRGASRSRGGRPIIAMRATAQEGATSRIVPVLKEGAGIVTSRGDVHYVVTEYGVANLHGRSVRERALALSSIAHPDFRNEILDSAKARHYVPATQMSLPEHGLPYPDELVVRSTLRSGRPVLYRPLRTDDERLLRDFFYSHTDDTIYLRYGMAKKRLTPAQVQYFVTLDYDRRMAIGAFVSRAGTETADEFDELIGVARYDVDPATNYAECAFTVHDDFQNQGIGTALLTQILLCARRRQVEGFTAQVLGSNGRMLHLFSRWCSPLTSTLEGGVYTLRFRFADIEKARRQNARAVPSESPGTT